MAYILIDGYNLIGIAHNNLEKARNYLIQRLQKYSVIKKHDITLVFDGWKSGNRDQTRTRAGHVTVIYSRLGETADVVIRKMLASTTKPWIVISSDREVSDYATKKEFAAVSSSEFERRINLVLQGFQENLSTDNERLEEEFMKYDEEDTDYPPPRQKGNPKKLSKKDKKKLQALRKLSTSIIFLKKFSERINFYQYSAIRRLYHSILLKLAYRPYTGLYRRSYHFRNFLPRKREIDPFITAIFNTNLFRKFKQERDNSFFDSFSCYIF
jgi:predicted RNA-binding protein with PIN domain